MRPTISFLFLLSLVFAATTNVQAQFRLKQVGATMGMDQDRLGALNGKYLIDAGRQDELNYDYSEMDLEPEDAYSWVCENPHIRLTTTWENPRLKNVEVGMNLLVITGRIDQMSYRGEYTGLNQYTNLFISQVSNELAAEMTLGYRLQGSRVFNLVGTIGANTGYHWGTVDMSGNVPVCDNNKVVWRGSDTQAPCDISQISENVRADGGISVRAFAGLRASFTISERLELGIDFRRGIGFRTVGEADTQVTNLHSAGISAGWNIWR